MKRMIIVTVGLLIFVCARIQGTELTFQWHGQTMGVDFEDTNLTASVKCAIRDDIAYTMSLIVATNVVFEPLHPSNPKTSKYSGFVSFSSATPVNYCDGVLCFYKNTSEGIVFKLGQSVCSRYVAAIALTNQFVSEVNAFSNFINQVKAGYNVANMTLDQKKALFWPPSIVEEWQSNMGNQFEQEITDSIPAEPAPVGVWNMPSILAYQMDANTLENTNSPSLFCELRVYGATSGTRKLRYIYANGMWRALIGKF